MHRVALFLAVLAGCTRVVSAQPHTAATWYARAYRTADGLSSSVIDALAQDSIGYLWLGTPSGLVRFDGTEFSAWGAHGEPRLPANSINTLMVSRDDALWLGFSGAGGVTRIKNGALVNYTAEHGLATGFVLALLEDRAGTVWAGGRAGLAELRNEHWHFLGPNEGLPPRTTVYSVREDRQGILWVATTTGLFRRMVGHDRFEVAVTGAIRDVTEDVNGTIWITDSKRAIRPLTQAALTSSRGSQRESLSGAVGSHLFSGSDGTLWVGTIGQGLFRLRSGVSDATPIESASAQALLSDEVVSTILEDRDHNVWVGTRGGLLRFYHPQVSMITRAQGLLSNTIRAVETTQDGSLWVATAEGLTEFPQADLSRPTRYPLPAMRITALYGDRLGRLWVGTEEGIGLFASGRFSPLRIPNDVRLGRIFEITMDGHDGLWLCHWGETWLSRWTGEFTEFDSDPAIAHRPCGTVTADQHGRVWVAFSDGSLVVRESDRFHPSSWSDGRKGEPIEAMFEDHLGVLWIVSDNRLSRIKDDHATSITERSGLPMGGITAVLEDDQEYLWLSSSSGLVRLAKQEFDRAVGDPTYSVRYEVYDASDGLLDAPTRYGARMAVRVRDGRLVFATVKGIAVVDPQRLPHTHSSAAARIERLTAGVRSYSPSSQLTLASHPPRVEIDYSIVSLSAASKASVRYTLDGLDPDWIPAGKSRQAVYTSLPPHSYRFRVRATIDGIDQPEADIAFVVLPAFYQRGWFLMVCGLAVIATGWTAWRLRVKTLQRRFRLVLSERTRIAREVHDTVLQSLAGVALQIEGVAKQFDLADQPSQDLRRIRRRIESQIAEARQAIAALRAPSPTVQRFDVALREFVADLQVGSPVKLDVVVTGAGRDLPETIQRELFRIGQEAVRNAVRHGHAQHVTIGVEFLTESIRLRVTDDGCGFDVAILHEHQWGLVGMTERAAQIGGRLTVTSAPGSGTRVEATVPVRDSSAS